MQRATAETGFILFFVVGGAMARQKSGLSGFKGGEFFCAAPAAEKILPGPWQTRQAQWMSSMAAS